MDESVTITEALNEIGKAARLFKAFEHAQKVLTVLQGIEQNERELRTRVARLADDVRNAERLRDEALAKAVKAGEDAKAEASRKLSEATLSAERLIVDAEKEAQRVVDAARTSAEFDISRRNAALAESNALSEVMALRREELAGLEARVANARDQIEKMLAVAR